MDAEALSTLLTYILTLLAGGGGLHVARKGYEAYRAPGSSAENQAPIICPLKDGCRYTDEQRAKMDHLFKWHEPKPGEPLGWVMDRDWMRRCEDSDQRQEATLSELKDLLARQEIRDKKMISILEGIANKPITIPPAPPAPSVEAIAEALGRVLNAKGA